MDFHAWVKVDIKKHAVEPSLAVLQATALLTSGQALTQATIESLPPKFQRAHRRLRVDGDDLWLTSIKHSKTKLIAEYEMNLPGYREVESLLTCWGELGLGEMTVKVTIDDEDGLQSHRLQWRNGAVCGAGDHALQRKWLQQLRLLEPYWSDISPTCQPLPSDRGARLYADVFPVKRLAKAFERADFGASTLLQQCPLAGLEPMAALALDGLDCQAAYRFDLGPRRPDLRADVRELLAAWRPWFDQAFAGGKHKCVHLVLFRYRYADGPRHATTGTPLDIVLAWSLDTGIARYSHGVSPRFVMSADETTFFSPQYRPLQLPASVARATALEESLMEQVMASISAPLQAQVREQYAQVRLRSRHSNAERELVRWEVPRSLAPMEMTAAQRAAELYNEKSDLLRIERLLGLVDDSGRPFEGGASLGIRNGLIEYLAVLSPREAELRRANSDR